MRWYKKLYMGDSLKHKKVYYRYLIEHTKKVTGTYCITLGDSDHSLLDIYHSEFLRIPYCEGREQLIVGLAGTKKESYELAARILQDTLNAAGNLNVKEYFASITAARKKR